MQNKRLWFLCASFFLVIGCAHNNADTGLKAPILELNETQTGLVWKAVSGAKNYELVVTKNGEAGSPVTLYSPEYTFDKKEGNYRVSVTAVKGKKKSAAAIYDYQTLSPFENKPTFDGTKLTWLELNGIDVTHTTQQVVFDEEKETYTFTDGEYTVPESREITITESGVHSFKTELVFVEEGHKYYPQTFTRVPVAVSATADYVIEDGTAESDADLSELYTITTYTSGWGPTGASIWLSNENDAFTDGNCVEIKYWHYGSQYFKYDKEITLNKRYGGLTFAVKACAYTNFIISFEINKHFIVGGFDLCGCFLKYEFATVPTEWTRYQISMDDPNWKIKFSGMDLDLAKVNEYVNQAGFKLDSFADLLQFAGLAQLRIRGAKGDYSTAKSYFDDVALVAEPIEETTSDRIEPELRIQSRYALSSDNAKGDLVCGENSKLNLRVGSNLKDIPVTVSVTDNKEIKVVSTEEDNDFVALFDSTDGGHTLTIKSVTGSLASNFTNATAQSITMLDDFESYEDTGVGYDNTHTEDQRSGLRGAYYADWYHVCREDDPETPDIDETEPDPAKKSPLGGPNWWLMASDNYLNLSTDIKFLGNKSAGLKNGSNSMRFISYNLFKGSQDSDGFRGSKFCFWIKGGNISDATLRVKVYYSKEVTAASQQSSCISKDFNIAKDSDWQLIQIDLTSSRTYYGFSMTPQGIRSETAQRLYLDNVYVVR